MKSAFWRKKDMQEDIVAMGGATQPDSRRIWTIAERSACSPCLLRAARQRCTKITSSIVWREITMKLPHRGSCKVFRV